MITSKWRKVLGDIAANKMRTFFVILAIGIGIFGISVVANSYAILLREMNKNYMNTQPASATLQTSALTDSEIKKIIDLPYIEDAEQREKIVGRVQVGDNEWKDIWLFVVKDFKDIRLDTFTSEKGKTAPDTGEILFERKALGIAKAEVGQSVNIRIPGGEIKELKLTGTVHAPGLAPAWMEGFAYGYITPDTLKLLGGTNQGTELKILVSEHQMDKQHIRENTNLVKEILEKDGVKVTHIEIPKPGKHPHYDQMATLLFLMEAFGVLALILSGILSANMINAMLQQQMRQIGIMKAVGASSLQIAGLYQGMVIIFAVTAMIISLPAGIYAGRGYAGLAAEILNFKIYDSSIPIYIFMLETAVGLLVPILTASYAVLKGSRVTVLEAINDYGISQKKYAGEKSDKSLRMHSLFSRPFLLSLRNTFRRKGRLIFTILVMAAGGTGFITAMNIYASMYNTVDEKMNSFSYDVQVTFEKQQPIETIKKVLSQIGEVKEAEVWGGASASRLYKDGTCGNNFNIIAPPSSAKFMSEPPLYKGRWLRADDTNALVINQRLLSNEAGIKTGDEVTLRINGTDTKWKVVGISKELIGVPAAYANREYLSEVLKIEGFAKNVVVTAKTSGPLGEAETAKKLEETLASQGMYISSLVKVSDYRKAIEDHLLIIATFLIIMSLLVAAVGGLGLATTVSISTLERTREIGVMRAVGASGHTITAIIVMEGMIIGILSWVIAVVLSLPLSQFISYNFGMTFFEAPLEFKASALGMLTWLGMVIIFAALASAYPSRKASNMPVKNALAYE